MWGKLGIIHNCQLQRWLTVLFFRGSSVVCRNFGLYNGKVEEGKGAEKNPEKKKYTKHWKLRNTT